MRLKLFEQQFFTEPDDDFCFQSENFQSENKSYAFYIGVKKNKDNEVTLTCITFDEYGNRDDSLHRSRHPNILTIYDDLERAAKIGLDSFINKLKSIDIGDKKLRYKANLYAEFIEEAMDQLTNKSDDRNRICES